MSTPRRRPARRRTRGLLKPGHADRATSRSSTGSVGARRGELGLERAAAAAAPRGVRASLVAGLRRCRSLGRDEVPVVRLAAVDHLDASRPGAASWILRASVSASSSVAASP